MSIYSGENRAAFATQKRQRDTCWKLYIALEDVVSASSLSFSSQLHVHRDYGVALEALKSIEGLKGKRVALSRAARDFEDCA